MTSVPQEWRHTGCWPLALAWVGFRASNEPLVSEAVSYVDSDELPTFRAILAWFQDDAETTEKYAQMALLKIEEPLEKALAFRHLAEAAVVLGRQNWESYFTQAIQIANGRDRGIIRSVYAAVMSNHGREMAARSEYLLAVQDLRGDDHWLADTWAGIGNICLRINELQDAERAFRMALPLAARCQKASYGLLHRYLGTVYRAFGEHERSLYFLRQAVSQAISPLHRVEALGAQIRTLALMNRRDEALEKAYEAAAHMHVLEAGSHPVLLQVALARLLIHDLKGAREALGRSDAVLPDDVFFSQFLWADLLRQEGDLPGAQAMIDRADERQFRRWRHTGWLFPEVYAMRGVVIPGPPEWQVRVSLDGPVRAWMHGVELPLRSTRAEAGLLALLVLHGGRVSRERALDALDLPGQSPQARRKALSAAVAALREVLGWPESVVVEGGLLRLSSEPRWLEPELPAAGRVDFFCEGRFDPWVVEWRSERQLSAD